MKNKINYKQKLIVSTLGTSILTNNAEKELVSLLRETSNKKEEALTDADARLIRAHADARKEALLSHIDDHAYLKQLSAELNGIITYYDEENALPLSSCPDFHILIASDTFQGKLVSGIIASWLEHSAVGFEVKRIGGLATDTRNTFRHAMAELAGYIREKWEEYRASRHIVFNLTGGFKGVQGFLQTLGMLYANECVYLFQTGGETLRLPRLPIQIDDSVLEEHISVFRRLDCDLCVAADDCTAIPELYLFQDGGDVMLSEWGKTVWGQAKDRLYEKRLWPSPSARIVYGQGVEKSVKTMQCDRIYKVNERIDDLAVYLEGNRLNNPKRLDFKPVKGTNDRYEMDAWSDKDAKRIFGHFEGERFVIEKIDHGFH